MFRRARGKFGDDEWLRHSLPVTNLGVVSLGMCVQPDGAGRYQRMESAGIFQGAIEQLSANVTGNAGGTNVIPSLYVHDSVELFVEQGLVADGDSQVGDYLDIDITGLLVEVGSGNGDFIVRERLVIDGTDMLRIKPQNHA